MSAKSYLLVVNNLLFQEVAQVVVLRRRIIGVFDQTLDVLVLVLVPLGSQLLEVLLAHAFHCFKLLQDVIAATPQPRVVEVQRATCFEFEGFIRVKDQMTNGHINRDGFVLANLKRFLFDFLDYR